MSEENVEIARRAWRAYAEGGLRAAAEYFAEDGVIEDFPDLPDRATYVGRDGLLARNRHFVEVWGDFRIEPVEFIDAGDEVIVVWEIHGHGTTSGAPVDSPGVFVYEIRDGLVVRDRAFTSKSKALAALGLKE